MSFVQLALISLTADVDIKDKYCFCSMLVHIWPEWKPNHV